MLITYKKRNGVVFQRIRNTYPGYRVGDTTSMGWEVLDIKYKYGNKYYSSMEYDKLLNKKYKKTKRFLELKHKLTKMYKYVNYLIVFLVLNNTIQNYIK